MVGAGDHMVKLTLERADRQWQGGLCLSSASAGQLAGQAAEWLHPQEYQRYCGFAHAKRAEDYLRGRYAAKQAVRVIYPALPATEIRIDSGIFQQPLLSGPLEQRVDVSISHSPGVIAAVAFPAAHPLAIDVETVDADNYTELRSQITVAEVTRLKAIREFSELEAVTAMWTIKEALSKALGCGLTAPISLFEVSEIHAQAGLLTARFVNFIQYKAIGFRWYGTICALVLPGRTNLREQAELVAAGLR